MQVTPRFRILPVLILVAMLAFSVRLVDFALGASSLGATANAQTAIEQNATQAPDNTLLSKPESIADKKEEMILAEADKESMADKDSPSKKATMNKDKTNPDSMSKNAAGEDDTLEDDTLEDDTLEDWRDSYDDEIEYSNISREVFNDLSKRRQKLDQQEKEIQTREALIRAAEQELDRKFQELSNLRFEIEGLLKQQSEQEQTRMLSLVKIYEGMKPKEAARIFDTLDLDVLVAVMSKMSERRLSPILANMNPERARTITIMLAEEKQLPSLPSAN